MVAILLFVPLRFLAKIYDQSHHLRDSVQTILIFTELPVFICRITYVHDDLATFGEMRGTVPVMEVPLFLECLSEKISSLFGI
jgi:hypothetical protein